MGKNTIEVSIQKDEMGVHGILWSIAILDYHWKKNVA